MTVAIIQIQNKFIIGEMEQLESEPSIVLHNSYELNKDILTNKIVYTKYPEYAHENVCVFASIHVLTIYPPSELIYDEYQELISSNKSEPELLIEDSE